MEHNLKGFTNEIQEQKSILVDIGLIIEFGLRDYREYLQTFNYDSMPIKMVKFFKQLQSMSDEQIELTLQKL